MAYNQALALMYLCLLTVGILYLIRWSRARRENENELEDDSDFAYLSVREQLAIASKTADSIAEAEQLITDMQESAADDIIIMHIEWLGRDDQMHDISVSCDGINTATDCLISIGEREIHDLKSDLAHQCAILSSTGRSSRNCGQNEQKEGSDEYDETLHNLRSVYING